VLDRKCISNVCCINSAKKSGLVAVMTYQNLNINASILMESFTIVVDKLVALSLGA
jgi:hypothetical protein